MSTAIEQRIVEMKFDRKGFAEGVKDTLKDLDKLDQGMKFEGARKGFSELQRSVDGIQFQSLLEGIQNIQGSLEHMQSFGFQVFQNLTNKAVDWATTMVKSLSVDQIAGGFSEYELKMDSVRTIMSSTGKDIDTVNKYLEELNEYSDKTIYSFSDMTSSIGKFTNAGVDLDKAVMAIKGISSEAALSGANAQQASAAMYNFSQALSSGAVKLIDWKSIENANMATKEFKQELLNTALALGTVVKHEGKYLTKTAAAEGKTDDAFDAVSNFNDSLKDEWMTSDVLVETLSRYADETSEIGSRAMAAAQEVTTYSKMMDALKEQVGSGWAQTFEILFGNLEEAKKLWTNINDVIGGFISGISDTRNGLLQMWKADETGGAIKDLIGGLGNIYKVIKAIGTYIGLALETIFGHRYEQNFDKVKEFFEGKSFSGNVVVISRLLTIVTSLTRKFKSLTDTAAHFFDFERKFNRKGRWFLEEIYQTTQAFLIPARAVVQLLTGLGGKVIPALAKGAAGVARTVIFLISRIGYAFTEGGLQEKLYKIADLIVNGLGGGIDFIVGKIDKLFEKFSRFAKQTNMSRDIQKMVNDGLGSFLDWVISALEKATEKGKALRDKLNPIIDKWIDKLIKFASDFRKLWKGSIEPAINTIKSQLGPTLESIHKSLSDIWAVVSPLFTKIGSGIWSGISWVLKKLTGFDTKALGDMGVEKLTQSLMKVATEALPFVQKAFEKLAIFVKNVATALKTLKKKITPFYKTVRSILKNIGDRVTKFISDTGVLGKAQSKIKDLTDSIKGWFKDTSEDSSANIEKMSGKIEEFVKKGMSVEDATEKVKHMSGDFEDLGGMMDWVGGKFDSLAQKISNSKLVTTVRGFVDGLLEKVKNNSFIKTITDSGIIENLKSFVDSIIKAAKEAFGNSDILGAFREFGGIVGKLVEDLKGVDWSNMGTIMSGVGDAFSAFGTAVNNFNSDKFAKIQEALQKFWDQLRPSEDPKDETEIQQTITKRFSNMVASAVGGLIQGISKLNWGNVTKILRTILSIKILHSLSKLFSKGEKTAKGLDKFMDVLGNTMNKVAGVFALSKWTVLSQAFLTFAKAMTYLVGGIVVLALIPPEDLERALNALFMIGGIFVIFYVVKSLIDKFINKSNETSKVADKAGEAVNEVKTALGKLVENSKTFFDAIAKGAQLLLAKIGNAFIIVGVGIAVLMLTGAVAYIAKNLTDTKVFLEALGKVALIIGVLVGFTMALMKWDEKCKTDMGDYLGIAAVIWSLMMTVDKFLKLYEVLKDIPFTDFLVALFEWGTIIGAIGLVIGLMIGMVSKFGVGLIKANPVFKNMTRAILVCALAIIGLSFLTPQQIFQGIAAIGGILLLIAGFTFLMSKIGEVNTGVGTANVTGVLLGIAAGFLALGASFWIFSQAVKTLADTGPQIREYSDEILNMIMIFLTVAAVVTVVGIAFGMLGGIGPVIGTVLLMIAGAIALVGLAFYLAGNGIKAAAEAAVIFAENMDTIISSVKGRENEVGESIQLIVSAAVKGVADGLAYLGQLIIGWLWSLLADFDANANVIGYMLGSSMMKLIIGFMHGLVMGFLGSFGFVKDTLADWWNSVTEGSYEPDYEQLARDAVAKGDPALANYYKEMAARTKENGKQVTEASEETGNKVREKYNDAVTGKNGNGKSMSETTSEEIDKADKVITEKTTETEASANELGTKTGAAWGSGMEQATKLGVDNFMTTLPPYLQQGYEYASANTDIGSLFNGIPGAAEFAAGEGSESLLNTFSEAVESGAGGTGFDINSDIAGAMDQWSSLIGDQSTDMTQEEIMDMIEKGDYSGLMKSVDGKVADGLTEHSGVIEDASTDTVDDGINAANAIATVRAPQIGNNVVNGAAIAIYKGSQSFINACGDMMKQAMNKMQTVADEHSPSKRTYKIGVYLVLGLINAIRDKGSSLVNASGDMMSDTLSALRESMYTAFNYFDENMEYSPVISPVIDSRGMQYGLQNMQGLMGSYRYSPNVVPNVHYGQIDVGSAVGDLSAVTTQGNSDLLAAIQRQNDELARLNYNLENQKIYLDGNTLVGKTVARMDQALGMRAVMAGGRR